MNDEGRMVTADEVYRLQDRLVAVVDSARAFLAAYDRAGGLASTQAEAAALDVALDELESSVVVAKDGTPLRPREG